MVDLAIGKALWPEPLMGLRSLDGERVEGEKKKVGGGKGGRERKKNRVQFRLNCNILCYLFTMSSVLMVHHWYYRMSACSSHV